MTEEEWLAELGLEPADLELVRDCLKSESEKENGDTLLMKLCCVQLFRSGAVDDVLLIWSAKQSSFDAGCSIDVQLLCGTGLQRTKTLLASRSEQDAAAALAYLEECERTGDFDGFTPEACFEQWRRYYAP
jgi:hypothetical protein